MSVPGSRCLVGNRRISIHTAKSNCAEIRPAYFHVLELELLSAPKLLLNYFWKGRAQLGPQCSLDFFIEFMAFRLIPVIYPARRAKPENDWKRYFIIFPQQKRKQFFHKINSWKRKLKIRYNFGPDNVALQRRVCPNNVP